MVSGISVLLLYATFEGGRGGSALCGGHCDLVSGAGGE